MQTVESPQYPRYISTALEASAVAKDSKGVLHEVTVTNTNAAAQFIQVHNATAVPSDTAVPLDIFEAPSGSSTYTWEGGLPCDTGISLSNSSSAATKTVGAADCWFSVNYE